ncbi:hypothetical protein [Ralstonia solanacearum]|nr:hypothetical protein [Ralstonia solanacearum]
MNSTLARSQLADGAVDEIGLAAGKRLRIGHRSQPGQCDDIEKFGHTR